MISDDAYKARLAYRREYAKANRDKLNAYQRRWRANHPDKVKAYNDAYWARKGAEMAQEGKENV